MKSYIITVVILFLYQITNSQEIHIQENDGAHQIIIHEKNKTLMSSPLEGLWSISLAQKENWPSNWQHIKASTLQKIGEWYLLSGKLSLPTGEWHFKDYYKQENNKIKCIRRFEWKGKTVLDSVAFNIRWQVPSSMSKPFLPSIMYYGNPSGKSNGINSVPWHNGTVAEQSLFEEHRFSMPFTAVEWKKNDDFFFSTLHSIPSPLHGGIINDQWWSLGLQTLDNSTELQLQTGAVVYNSKQNAAKALQQKHLNYRGNYLTIQPGTIIEKTFYLEAFPVEKEGTGFQRSLYSSLDIFKPYSTVDLPASKEIIESKYKYAKARWMEGHNFAGFNMYPAYHVPQIVLGWAGQSEAPAFALQVLNEDLKDPAIFSLVQKSLDHITSSTIDKDGFNVIYDIKSDKWASKDPVSQGQAMYTIGRAIAESKKHKLLNSSKWNEFFFTSSDIIAEKILDEKWNPINTAETFFIAPLIEAYKLNKNSKYLNAAIKAADYFIIRHGNMREPYWGGTLDAICEDKEGAWGAFQAFLAVYEVTKNKKYLTYAKHACDVVLSYVVVWDIPLPAGRLADHAFKSRGWTSVSVQNQHLDVYGVLIAPSVYKMGKYLNNEALKKIARVMFLSCGQLIDAEGAQGEQIQQTNFAQHGKLDDVYSFRGGYSENWTVFWITAHFLTAAAEFKLMNVEL